jgi:signal transduction histidine kinase
MWADLAFRLSQGRSRTLTRRADRAVEALSSAPANPPERRIRKYDEFAAGTPEGNLIRVLDQRGQLLYPKTSNVSPDFPWPPPNAKADDRIVDFDYRGRKFRVLQHPAAMGDELIDVEVCGQLQDNRQLLEGFSHGLFWAIPALLAVSALGGYFMSRRALKPVDRLTAAVRSISIGNLSERLPIRGPRDELQRLAETSNEMLARLEAAFVQIKRFTADASHELRSPLSYVQTVAEYALRDRSLQPETREAFEEILAESREATHLLEDMLVLARADAGQTDMRFEPTDLAELVEDVCERARGAASAKRHALIVHRTNGAHCIVQGDRSSLRRLLWTLVDNAIKYTPEGGHVEVELEHAGAEAMLSVRDSGIGIPKDLLPRIFERFFRADPARSQVDGTGLGLAIAKWIADVHHAELRVESTEGEGSAFTVVFPRTC